MKIRLFMFILCLIYPICLSDTFIHKETGKTFDGYPTQIIKHNKTLVRTGTNYKAEYINLSEYNVERNNKGRRNKVIIININHPIEYDCVTKSLEKTIESASNQGPEFILLEIDTPGGRISLAERLCNVLSKADNCRTIAFINGGAISAGAILALACDNVYMTNSATIGGATSYVEQESGPKDLKEAYGDTVGEKMQSIWIAFCESVAQKNNRPSKIVKAMIDKDISVIEVSEKEKRYFIFPNEKKKSQKFIKELSAKGSLLTLTATEAVQCGIADGIVESRENLISQFASQKVKHISDNRHLKIRKAYSQIADILADIKTLEAVWVELISEIEKLDETIAKTEKTNTKFYRDRYRRRYTVEKESATGARAVRENKIKNLKNVLSKLINEYKTAISKAQKISELGEEVKQLRENLKAVNNAYKKLQD